MRDVLRIIAVGVSCLLLSACGGPRRSLIDKGRPVAPRPSHFGYSLPFPVSELPYVVDSGFTAVSTPEKLVPLILRIDRDGLVLSVEPDSPDDTAFVSHYTDYLSGVEFTPGLIGGERSTMDLSILLQVGAVGSEPIVRYPVEPNRNIRHTDFYWQSFERYGVVVPSLVGFPSYYYRFEGGDQWRRYPFKIFKVTLDSSGAATTVELVNATSPDHNDQIRSAIFWGKYTPLVMDGKKLQSVNYLVVSLYPSIKYPTRAINVETTGPPMGWDRSRVRLAPDTAGLMASPVPKREWSGPIDNVMRTGMIPDLVTAQIQVDSSGSGMVRGLSTDFWKARSILIDRAVDHMFFPARSFSGQPEDFEGMVYLRYVDKENVRIWFDWLGGTDPGPPAQDTVGQ